MILDMADIRAAAKRIDGIAHRTPVLSSRTLDRYVDATVLLKAENMQRAGAFKFRGAYNKISTLSPSQLAGGVCTWSSGNHAQAVALASALLGTTATVLMPEDAPVPKRRLAGLRCHGHIWKAAAWWRDCRTRVCGGCGADRTEQIASEVNVAASGE